MKVKCEVEVVDVDGEYGTLEGVEITCSRCGHTVESYGTSERSVRRCFALLREECPNGECNFYCAPDFDTYGG